MSKTVFISYNWQGPTSGIVNNWLYPSLKEMSEISVSVDRKDCKYHDSIEEFEKQIGNAQLVVAVINEAYLHSLHCMYEATSVIKNGDIPDRLYLVLLVDNLPSCDVITAEWQRKEEELQASLLSMQYGREPYEKMHRQIKMVLENIGTLWVYMEDRNRLCFSDVSRNNFQVLKDRLNGFTVRAEYQTDKLLEAWNGE